MPDKTELKSRLWKAIKDDKVMMVGLASAPQGHARPLTAQTLDDDPTLWFFVGRDNDLTKKLGSGAGSPAFAHFVSKGHNLFASIDGRLMIDNDPLVIDRLWNSFVAAWYPGGKTDPNLVLLRFDPGNAEIWLNDSGLLAGIKMLLGSDPKADYKDKVGVVNLR